MAARVRSFPKSASSAARPAAYNVYLGGGFAGQRLSKLYRESLPRNIKPLLAPIIMHYAKERSKASASAISASATEYVAATVQGGISTKISSPRPCLTHFHGSFEIQRRPISIRTSVQRISALLRAGERLRFLYERFGGNSSPDQLRPPSGGDAAPDPASMRRKIPVVFIDTGFHFRKPINMPSN
jgi:hypothetical protein